MSPGRSPLTDSAFIVGELDDDAEGIESDVAMPTRVPWASRDSDTGKKNRKGTVCSPKGAE